MRANRIFLLVFHIVGLLGMNNAQTLEIHQMSVGAADAAVIVVRDVARMRDSVLALNPALVPANPYELLRVALQNKVNLAGTVKKTILIDAAESSPKYAKKIDKYLEEIGVEKSLDYVVLSHLDKDHYGGFNELLDKYGYTINTKAYHPDNVTAGYPKPSKTCNKSFFNRIPAAKREIARANSTEIGLGIENGKEIKLTCVVADCYVLHQNPATPSFCPGSNDYNDHSIGWILQYGAFRFYTGGDLNGLFPKYAIETDLANALIAHDPATYTQYNNAANVITPGHTCAMKLNHHGSDNSTNVYFLSVLKPKTAFISCGYHEGHRHPRSGVIQDLEAVNWNISDWGVVPSMPANSLERYYVTALLKNLGLPVDNIGIPPSKGVIGGDLTLIVDDVNIATQSKFAVYFNGKLSIALEGKNGRDPNDKNIGGLHYYQCHRAAAAQNYITNH